MLPVLPRRAPRAGRPHQPGHDARDAEVVVGPDAPNREVRIGGHELDAIFDAAIRLHRRVLADQGDETAPGRMWSLLSGVIYDLAFKYFTEERVRLYQLEDQDRARMGSQAVHAAAAWAQEALFGEGDPLPSWIEDGARGSPVGWLYRRALGFAFAGCAGIAGAGFAAAFDCTGRPSVNPAVSAARASPAFDFSR